MKNSEAEVIIVVSGTYKSMLSSAVTYLCLGLVIYVGVLLDSTAMQWMGFVLASIAILSLMVQMNKKNRYTVSQARKRIDEIEQEFNA